VPERGSIEGADSVQQDLYHQLCVYTLSHRDPAFIHQHVVDTFAAQAADAQTKPITLAFGLVGLFLHVERQFTGKQVQRVHMLLAGRRKQWPRFDPPENRGAISVADVIAAAPGPERDLMIDRWCESVWQTYAASRDRIMELLQTELGYGATANR
jgi:hypothetical protein